MLLGLVLFAVSLIHLINSNFSRANFNIAYIFFIIPIVFAWVSSIENRFLSSLQFVVAVNVAISIFQHVSLQLNFTDLALMFNNYYSQTEYVYPLVNGLYRTAGLFTESSQYSVFLAIYLYNYLHNDFKKSKFVFSIALIDLLINQSLLGYISLILIILSAMKISLVHLTYLVLISSLFIFYQFDKLFFTLSFYNADSFPRLSSAVNNIISTWELSPLIGQGLTWHNPSWDILSVMFKGFGIVGIFATFLFLVYIFYISSNITIFLMFLANMLVNGNLAIPINLIFLAVLWFNSVNNGKLRENVRF